MILYAIKLSNGDLYRPKKHGPKVYTRYQDASMVRVNKNLKNSRIVTYSPTWV